MTVVDLCDTPFSRPVRPLAALGGRWEGQNEEDIDSEAGTVHLILAFVKGVTAGPNSANEPADSPQPRAQPDLE